MKTTDSSRRPPAELLRQLIGSERAVGTFVKLPATEVIDIIGLAGLDFAVVDLEHSQLTEGDALRLVRHAAATATPALVRLPDCDSGLINRSLEAGAAGIQLSSVRTVGQVRSLVASSRYAPAGRRSVSLAHPSAGYGSVGLRDAVNAPHPLLVGQIEHGETDDDLADILRQGLDVAFVGVTDLTVDVGFDDARVERRIEDVRDTADRAGVPVGIFAGSLDDAPGWASYVTVSSDVSLLRAATEGITRG